MSDDSDASEHGCQCLLYSLYMSVASDETGLVGEDFCSMSIGYATAGASNQTELAEEAFSRSSGYAAAGASNQTELISGEALLSRSGG